ncbi:MAG: DUF996 domain-containing protein [Candidatus Bathyarchaeota archaeon]|nr:DUF996 domain-containing protein [Candidatus Termiticorpusculum sp.]
MTIGSNKILAGIGSLLYGVPIIGLVLIMIGMKGLSEHYREPRIYDGLVTGVILLIISSILSIIGMTAIYSGMAGLALAAFSLGMMSGAGIGAGIIGIAGGIVCFIVCFILALLAIRHVRNCLNALAERSGENLFRTAGTLIWVGAILTIIGIGALLIWIGFIIAAIGFFTLKETPLPPTYGYTPPPSNTQSPSPPTASFKSNFCPNCGTAVAPEATFCAHCGKQI